MIEEALVAASLGGQICGRSVCKAIADIIYAPKVVIQTSDDCEGKINGSIGPSLVYRLSREHLDRSGWKLEPVDKHANIVQRRIPVIQSTLFHILEVQFEHMGVGAERIPRIASLIKVFQVPDGGDDKFAIIIDEHITSIALTCVNFNYAHRPHRLPSGEKCPSPAINGTHVLSLPRIPDSR